MKSWFERSPEVSYLLNSAFCARILYGSIVAYKKECKREFPFVLSYLILPIILHKETRQRIKTVTYMQVWLQKNPELLIGYAKRAKSLVPITSEAIEYLMQTGTALFNGDNILINRPLKPSKLKSISDEEMIECFNRAEALGKWFARNGTVENIYQSWGVRP